jgi:hypothetical protein
MEHYRNVRSGLLFLWNNDTTKNIDNENQPVTAADIAEFSGIIVASSFVKPKMSGYELQPSKSMTLLI